PLPKVRVPITVARLWSCNAPATISEAEAEPALTNTTMGMSCSQLRLWADCPLLLSSLSTDVNGLAKYSRFEEGIRPLVDTTASPGFTNADVTPIALSSKPPGSL